MNHRLLNRLLSHHQYHHHHYQTNFIRYYAQVTGFKPKKDPKKKEFILFPSIPPDTVENNEALRLPIGDETPNYPRISPVMCHRAFIKTINLFHLVIDNDLDAIHDTDKALSKSFEEIYLLMEKGLVPVEYVNSLMNSLSNLNRSRFKISDIVLQNCVYNKQRITRKRFESDIIYKYFREFNANIEQLPQDQKTVVRKYILEQKLNGLTLTGTDSERFEELEIEHQETRKSFVENIQEAENRFEFDISDRGILKKFPPEFLVRYGSSDNLTVNLSEDMYHGFMESCPLRALRYNTWRAYNNRASMIFDPKISNSVLIEHLRSNRKTRASLLGYENYAEMSMETKMAGSIGNVASIIEYVHNKSQDAFNDDLKELNSYATNINMFDGGKIELWDVEYLKNNYKVEEFGVGNTESREYFPLNTVIQGMFNFCETIFHVKIEQVNKSQVNVWNEDVQCYRVINDGGIAGTFFLDPYSRSADKRSGNNFMFEPIINRCRSMNTKPICNMITTFQKPLTKEHITTITFDELLGLFKLFGIVLQFILNDMPYCEISGINNIEWDRVLMCSEFLQMWPLKNYKIIEQCSAHRTNGDSLPKKLYQKLTDAHFKFNSVGLKQELYKIAVDLALSSNTEIWRDVDHEIYKIYMSPFISSLGENNHLCSSVQIISDNPAAYFSDFWAKMLAADAFMAFQEANSAEELEVLGDRFKNTFLKLGGGRDGDEIFKQFRGGEYSPDAFLVLNNLVKDVKPELPQEISRESMERFK